MMKKSKDRMTSRERVLATIEGKPVDRVPVMYWPNPHAALKLMHEYQPAPSRFWNFVAGRMWKRFTRHGEMDGPEIWRALPLLYTIYAVNEYALQLGADIADAPFGSLDFWGGKLYRRNGRIQVKDNFGSIRGIGGIYLDVVKPGVQSIEDLKNIRLPDASADKNYANIRKYRARHPDACFYADNFGVQDFPTTQMWEMSQMMMAFIDYPDEMKEFMRRFGDLWIEIGVNCARAGADIIFIYDDYGYTNRPLMSMEMWKEFTFPHLKRMIAAYHEEGAKVMLHSCGYQMPFLPYYIEAELDVLQTFQPKAGNDFAKAYAEYGDKLTFNTGIDIQLGEFMTPQEMREDILKNYRIGGRNGRHIIGMTHMLQYTMPIETMRAIFDTVREIQEGKHDN